MADDYDREFKEARRHLIEGLLGANSPEAAALAVDDLITLALIREGLIEPHDLGKLNGVETEAMDHVISATGLITGWGLKANGHELTAAVHVIQGFIVQHMLHRLNPSEWSSWYEED